MFFYPSSTSNVPTPSASSRLFSGALGLLAGLCLLPPTTFAATTNVNVLDRQDQIRFVDSEFEPGAFGLYGNLHVRLPGTTRIENLAPIGKGPLRTVEVDLFIPADAPLDLWISMYAKDKDGTWFQTSPGQPWEPGKWQTLSFDFGADAPGVRAAGHGAVWNNYWGRHMTEVGLQFFSASPWIGTIPMANIRIRNEERTAETRIEDFRMLTRQPKAYQLLEFEFSVPGDIGNPFNPEDIQLDTVFTTPEGNVRTVPAFYYQKYSRKLDDSGVEQVAPEGPGVWRVRMTPFESGLFTWRLEGHVRGKPLKTRNHSIDIAPGQAQGFVRVSPVNPLFFETADGEFYYGIGHNIRSPTDVRSERRLNLKVKPDGGTFIYDDFFGKMAANGENAGMIWMANWWVSIEWNANWRGFHGINDYNLGNAWRLDHVLEEAQRRGIYIYLDIDNHGKYSTFSDPEWQTSPFNVKNGGPCNSPLEMFKRDDMFELYAHRIRYITARWGAQPNIIGWNLISEINLTGESGGTDRRHDTGLFEWIRKAADLFHELDSHNHVVGTQWSGDWRTIYPTMAALEELDIVVGDSYKGANHSIVDMLITTAENLSKHGKPYFTAEFGGNWSAARFPQLHADLHAGIWSNAMTVNAMAPMLWWFDYIDHENLYSEFKSLFQFVQDWDPRDKELKTIHTGVLNKQDKENPVRAVLLHMDDTAVNGWIYDTKSALEWPDENAMPEHSGINLPLSSLADGDYHVEFWNTASGEIMHTSKITVAQGKTELELPDFNIDLAFKARKKD
jgi:hypothetical protein